MKVFVTGFSRHSSFGANPDEASWIKKVPLENGKSDVTKVLLSTLPSKTN